MHLVHLQVLEIHFKCSCIPITQMCLNPPPSFSSRRQFSALCRRSFLLSLFEMSIGALVPLPRGFLLFRTSKAASIVFSPPSPHIL